MLRKIFTATLLFTVSVLAAAALDLPEPMKPARLVNDFAGIFNPAQRQALESRLVGFADSTSTQIAVVSVDDLDGTAISDYAARLFDKWGIGGGTDRNNGILILVKPKTATSRGEVFISTGYGLEGAVPDALAGRIVDYDMLPRFRQGDYYGGVNNAVSTLMGLTRGEFTADQYLSRHTQGSGRGGLWAVLGFLALLALLTGGSKKGPRHTITSEGDVARAILWGSILSSGHHRSGGGFGGFSGGGDGFGGFGGGFTGGGGAGGSW